MPKDAAEYVRLYGRDYKVVAKFKAGQEAAANAFIEANPGTGVITEDDCFIYIAGLNDKGTPVQRIAA